MSVNFKNIELFDGKTYEDLLKDIYTTSKIKATDFKLVLDRLIEVIKSDPTQAMIIMPLIIQYSEVSLKNDDALIKLAGIIQRSIVKDSNEKNNDIESLIPEHEIELLLKNSRKIPEIQEPETIFQEIELKDIHVSDSGSNRNQKSIQTKSKR